MAFLFKDEYRKSNLPFNLDSCEMYNFIYFVQNLLHAVVDLVLETAYSSFEYIWFPLVDTSVEGSTV